MIGSVYIDYGRTGEREREMGSARKRVNRGRVTEADPPFPLAGAELAA